MTINFTKVLTRLPTLAIAVALAGCGGGGGGGGNIAPPQANTPPPPVSVTASGVITGFSSVILDGIKYEVENDTIVRIEDELDVRGDDSRLRIGMKVRIEATESSGVRVANHIEYDEDLKGPAMDVTPDALDPSIGSFTVVRQLTIVDGLTVFDDDVGDNNGDGSIDIRDLELPGGGRVVVEVSGLAMADGFVATRIDRVNNAGAVPGVPGDEWEIKGEIDAVAGDLSSFTINTATFLIVQGAGGTEFEDGLTADTLLGQFVEVKADEDVNGDLLAVKVEREDDIGDQNGDGSHDNDDRRGEFEIKGILISVDTSVSPHLVKIGLTTLEVADASSLEGLEGSLLELEGTFDDNGVLTLSEVDPEEENSIRIEDRVAAGGVSTTDGTITTRLGVVVTPTGLGRIEDDVDDTDGSGDHLTVEEFLDRVMDNDFIEARAVPDTTGNVGAWTRVEREDEDDLDCELRGPVTSLTGTSANDFSFTILNVTVDVSRILTDDGFRGDDDLVIGRQAFFDRLQSMPNAVVKARSDDLGLGCEHELLTAERVEFEAGDDVVGTLPGDDDRGIDDELVGTPATVTDNTFVLNGRTITVLGSTLIDDSMIEAATGMEIDGDRRFDQVPGGVTLQQLLPGTFMVEVKVNANDEALSIEDI